MNPDEILDEMKRVAEKLDVRLRLELMPALGGLCTVKGRKVIFLNTALEPWDQVDVLARSLAQLPTDSLFMTPQVREIIERYKG
jgi:hypothetical protein